MAKVADYSSFGRGALSIVVSVLCGYAIGVTAFGVGYAELPSYFSSDPENCTNCHVMQEQYDSWSRGPHVNVATCDDCHLPHDNITQRYLVQAEDGLLHGYKFTTGDYPTNIVIRESSRAVVNSACLYCHGEMVTNLYYTTRDGETINCTRCHSQTGHD